MKTLNIIMMVFCSIACAYLFYIAVSDVNTEAGIWGFISLLLSIIFGCFATIEDYKERYESLLVQRMKDLGLIES